MRRCERRHEVAQQSFLEDACDEYSSEPACDWRDAVVWIAAGVEFEIRRGMMQGRTPGTVLLSNVDAQHVYRSPGY